MKYSLRLKIQRYVDEYNVLVKEFWQDIESINHAISHIKEYGLNLEIEWLYYGDFIVPLENVDLENYVLLEQILEEYIEIVDKYIEE